MRNAFSFVGPFVLCAAVLSNSSCGGTAVDTPLGPSSGSSGVSAPSSPSSPSGTPPLPPGPGSLPVTGIQIVYEEAVSDTDRQIVAEAISIAQEYFLNTFGKEVRSATLAVVATDGCDGVATMVSITPLRVNLCVSNPGWSTLGKIQKTKIVVHESSHFLQRENSWPNEIWWMLEGSAEYIGWAAVISKGMASYQTVLSCQVANYFGSGANSYPALNQIDRFSGNGKYYLGWIAWDNLLGGTYGIPKISATLSGDPFESTYGRSVESFYDEFAAYRLGLMANNGAACVALRN